jgi:RNA polymerase sigma-70 factor (ECF subfamily)
MMRRHDGAESRALHGAGATAEARLVADDPEMALIKGGLRDKFETAVNRGLASLGDRERMVLSLHLVDELTLEEIGKMYGVNHSTVSRCLGKALASVVAEARRVMRDELDVRGDELESVAGLLVSRLDISVSWLLQRVS